MPSTRIRNVLGLAALALRSLGIAAGLLGIYTRLRLRLWLWRSSSKRRFRRALRGLPPELADELAAIYDGYVERLRLPGLLEIASAARPRRRHDEEVGA